MRYPDTLVGWLFDVLDGIEWRWTPMQILDVERHYPGLITDLGIEGWQRRLVKAQVNDENEGDNSE